MNTGVVTENLAVAKGSTERKANEPSFVRIEIHVRPSFYERLEEAREKRGLSRSAYIRQAVLMLMDEDEDPKPRSRKRS